MSPFVTMFSSKYTCIYRDFLCFGLFKVVCCRLDIWFDPTGDWTSDLLHPRQTLYHYTNEAVNDKWICFQEICDLFYVLNQKMYFLCPIYSFIKVTVLTYQLSLEMIYSEMKNVTITYLNQFPRNLPICHININIVWKFFPLKFPSFGPENICKDT